MKVTMEASAAVKTSAESLGGLMGSQLDQAGQLALMDGKLGTTESTSTGPSLEELVGVMAGVGIPKAKAKGKAKAKAKANVSLQHAKTPGEQREAMRRLV